MKLPSKALNLDGTSLHVDSVYNSKEDPDDLNCIHICRGYSRDYRPDLNQVVLQLMTKNEAGIPVFMVPASGNVNDKTCFQEIIKNHLSCFKAALNSRYLVADAAMYVAETLQSLDEQKQRFISRVPPEYQGCKGAVGKAHAMPCHWSLLKAMEIITLLKCLLLWRCSITMVLVSQQKAQAQ